MSIRFGIGSEVLDLREVRPAPDRRSSEPYTSAQHPVARETLRARARRHEDAGGDTAPRTPMRPLEKPRPRRPSLGRGCYLISTVAPTSSNFFLMVAASSLETPSLTTLGRAVDQVLGLLEAEARHLAHDLDDVDLLVAGARQVHRELGLLLGRSRRRAAAAAPPPPSSRGRRRRRDAPLAPRAP